VTRALTHEVEASSGWWDRFRSSPWIHPLLLAAFPVLYLWASNLDDQIPVATAGWIVLACVAAAFVVLLICRFLIASRDRAALVASIVVLWALAFGHVRNALGIVGSSGRETLLLVAWCGLAIALVVIAMKVRVGPGATRILNLVGVFLVAVNLVPIVRSRPLETTPPTAGDDVLIGSLDASASGTPRDVYYLIFDRYANERTLTDLYGYDDSAFIGWLEDQGLEVEHDAVANYPQTTHSLASSLNMTYLDDLASRVGTDSSDWRPLQASLEGPAVAKAFTSMGYRYVHIGSYWASTFTDPTADVNYVYRQLAEFPEVFLQTTVLDALAEHTGVVDIETFEEAQAHRVQFQEDALHEVSMDPRPTFTFAHFTLPHPPYVFDAEGNFRLSSTDMPIEQQYLDQLTHANDVIESIVGDLLRGPADRDPIVVVQSDEGPHPPDVDVPGAQFAWASMPDVEVQRKLRILNAYYLPGPEAGDLPAEITPVNTFRFILDEYFGGEMPMVKDRAYVWQDGKHPYTFIDVTDVVRS
jgi:hypothetical protein